MIRDGRYKYIWNPTDIDEFYDLEKDPDELHNLAGSSVDDELGAEYRQKILELYTELGDKLVTRSTWMRNWLNSS